MEPVARRTQMQGRGGTDRELHRGADGDERVRLWPGTFLDASYFEALGMVQRHRAVAVEAARKGGGERVLSHLSALAVHGVPMLDPDLRRIHFTSAVNARRTRYVIRHQAQLASDEVCAVDGVMVTTLERSLCDAARLGSFDQAVVLLDAGLRMGADPAVLAATIDRLSGCSGIARLRDAFSFADPLSESVGESFSRSTMSLFPEVPTPRLQVNIFDADGKFIARPDFLIGTVVGEFDGLVKYSGGLGDDSPSEVVVKEKLREDALRAEGYVVCRWIWRDLREPARLRRILHRALAAAGMALAPAIPHKHTTFG
ncbi:MAG: hypothetical protein QM673_08860 [Gordonia sp. (in: high G+C Gram-positive bacteria)]